MNEWHPMTGLRDSAGRDETDIQSLPVLATTDRVTWLWGQRWNWHIVLTSSSHNWHACVVFVLHIHSASPFGSFTPYWSVRTIKKDDAVKVLHSICQQIWKTQQWPQDWKRSIFIPIPKKGNAKECSNYHTIALISHASKITLKILQGRLQQYVNWEFPDKQAGFRKGGGIRDQIANIGWIIEKARELKKKSTSASLNMLKSLTVWITTNCGTFLKRW